MPTLTDIQKSILLAIGLILTAAILHVSSIAYITHRIQNKIDNLKTTDSVFQKTLEIPIPGSNQSTVSLINQYNASQIIKNYYLDISVIFYRNFYAFAICGIVFGTILVIATFLLITTGWRESSLLIKTFFLTTILISSFYFFLPTVLNNRDNYALNLKKVKTFNQIQMNILSFSAQLPTKKYLNNSDSLSAFLVRSYDNIASNFDLETVDIHSEKLGENPADILKSIKP